MKNKEKEYQALVEKRKICSLCEDLENPSEVNPEYDSDEIGMWSLWQGDLNAKIMIVGQDWGDIKTYNEWKGRDKDTNKTNANLIKLLSLIGYDVENPETSTKKNNGFFFTNSVLCLKKGGMQAPVDNNSFKKCMETFMKPLIELISPKLVITLGKKAYDGITSLYNLEQKKCLRDAVRKLIQINRETNVYAVYHCGAGSINRNRRWEEMKQDWIWLNTQNLQL